MAVGQHFTLLTMDHQERECVFVSRASFDTECIWVHHHFSTFTLLFYYQNKINTSKLKDLITLSLWFGHFMIFFGRIQTIRIRRNGKKVEHNLIKERERKGRREITSVVTACLVQEMSPILLIAYHSTEPPSGQFLIKKSGGIISQQSI